MGYPFRIRWTIEGIPELSRILYETQRKVQNFREPLFKSSRLILQDVERNFMTEGGLVGGWEDLAEATVKGRLRAGFGGEHPILQRTGTLRRSFKGYVDSKKAVITSVKVPYYKFHQSRMPRKTKLPRRAMLVLTKQTRENIVQNFNEFLRFK